MSKTTKLQKNKLLLSPSESGSCPKRAMYSLITASLTFRELSVFKASSVLFFNFFSLSYSGPSSKADVNEQGLLRLGPCAED